MDISLMGVLHGMTFLFRHVSSCSCVGGHAPVSLFDPRANQRKLYEKKEISNSLGSWEITLNDLQRDCSVFRKNNIGITCYMLFFLNYYYVCESV